LIAGKNEQTQGFQKFANAQFYENLTKEQFSGNYRNAIAPLNASRNSLNPAVNLEKLKNRLWVAEHYRLLHGVEHAYWPHYAMRNVGTHLNKYKFNYLVKAFFAYQVYREVNNYQYMQQVKFLTTSEGAKLGAQVAWTTFLFGSVCLLI
jgi:hypothetical protein